MFKFKIEWRVLQWWRGSSSPPWWSSTCSWRPPTPRSWTWTPTSPCPRASTWTVTHSPWPTATCCPNSTSWRWDPGPPAELGPKSSSSSSVEKREKRNPLEIKSSGARPQVVSKALRDFEIPAELTALTRYLDNAYKQEDFRYTCPRDPEILSAYHAVAKFK